jgi:hypothetical protein
MWVPFAKTFAGLSAAGALFGSCAHAVQSGVEGAQSGVNNVGDAINKVEDYANPRVCQVTVDGVTGTTIIGDKTFGVEDDGHGNNVITRELGECNR